MLRRISALPQVAWGAFLGIVTTWAYWPALQGGFLWDDAAHVTAPALRSIRGLGRIWFELGATQQYYPVLHTFFWLEHRLWGDATLGYHVANLALHLLAAGLFYALLRRWGFRWAGWAAAVFTLHPVAAESVAWISEEKNTLSLVFYLAAALAYGRFDRSRTGASYALAFAFYLLAVLSKSVTATLPAALLVVIWWQRGRLIWVRDVRPLLPWLVVGAGAGCFTAWVEHSVVGAHGAGYNLTWVMRLLLASRAIGFYLGKLLWPANLAFIYPHWTIDPRLEWQWVFPLGCAAVLAALFWLSRAGSARFPHRAVRWRGPLATALLFVGTLFPALGFVNLYPFVYSYVADHFQYHADLAIFAAAAALGARGEDSAWVRTRPLRAWWPMGAAGAVLAIFAIQTHRQSFGYTDLETLYRVTFDRNPECALADNNLGVLLARTGRSAEAIGHYRHALAIKPDYAEAENNLGDELALMPGREAAAEAVTHFEAAVRIRPDYYVAHDNLANQLAQMPGRWPEAERHFAEALRLKPDYAKAENDRAIALARMPGRTAEALVHYQAALRIDPGYAEAHANYALELAGIPGRSGEALEQYAAAVAIAPGDAAAHNNWANLLATIPGRSAEAVEHYETALRLQPGYAEAHNNLANELIKQPGREAEALREYEAAVKLRPDYADAHNNLAIAYANAGRLAEAEQQFRLALKSRPDFPQARDNLQRLLGH